ncbi:MAG: cell division FtsA domain-containing protein [Clostridia bacterium]|jgi:cell division protein FtsA|nr:hypothetical protein [Clostridia bacterium]
MINKEVAVLEFGSSKITVTVGSRDVNNTFNIRAKGEAPYEGFADGNFLSPENLKSSINTALTLAEKNLQTKIKNLYIGVPGEFSYSICKNGSLTFKKKTRITEKLIDSVYTVADDFSKNSDYTIISVTPVYFTLDDNRRFTNSLGLVTKQLSVNASYVLAENRFINTVNKLLSELKLEGVYYLSEPLCTALNVLDTENRERYAILIDCGFTTTTVCLIKGEGLLLLNSFSLGGGYITSDLAECLNLTFDQAESLKRKVILSLNASESDIYEAAISATSTKPISTKTTNEIVSARVEMIGKTILKCLASAEYKYPDYIPINITGGGISYIKGIKDFLSKLTGREICIVSPEDPDLSKPDYSSFVGLLDMALKQNEYASKGFLQNIFSKHNR